MANYEKPVMLYDGECGFCRNWVEKWRKITGEAVLYFPYKEKLKDFSEFTNEKACREAVQLITPQGRVFSGAHAVFKTFALSHKRKWLLYFYERVPFFGKISELVYQWVSRNRSRL